VSSAVVEEEAVLSAAGPAVQASFNSPMMLLKFEIVAGWAPARKSARSHPTADVFLWKVQTVTLGSLPSMSTRKKLKRNCRFSLV